MHARQFIPRNSGPHRIACIALYRSLLSECQRIPLPLDLPFRGPINPLKHFIRKRFKRNAHHTSPRLVVAALKAGYKAEELLRSAASANPASLAQLHTLLRTLSNESSTSRPLTPPVPPHIPYAPRIRPYPGAPKVLEIRPLPAEKLSGRRVVPSLESTGGLPFLRFKKPQSTFLARVLRNKLEKKQKRVDQLEAMEQMLEWGTEEARWEGAVADVLKEEIEERKVNNSVSQEARERLGEDWASGERDWTKDTKAAMFEMDRIKDVWFTREKEMEKKMVEIIEKEQELLREEKEKRSCEKHAIKVAKKRDLVEGIAKQVTEIP